MSARVGAASRARKEMPASVILPSCELKHYRRWQRLYSSLPRAKQGYVSTAEEYEDFQQWRKKQDSGYFSDVFDDISDHIMPICLDASTSQLKLPMAAICHHAMHPITMGQVRPRCPVCTIDMHLNYLKVLSQALAAAGGRAPSCTLTVSEHQDTMYNAWSHEKICMLKELSDLERMAEQEAEWLTNHPGTSIGDTNTATKALELYWFESNAWQEVKPNTEKEKRVDFTEDTDFLPGRPQAYYWKRSPRYQPGKYASIGTQDEDEGAVSEDSKDYAPLAIFRFISAQESRSEELSGVKEPPQTKVLDGEFQEEDDDSDWEDVESDDESSDFVEDNIVYEIEDETSFVVFADD